MTTRRLYYDDAFQREFAAQVLRCEPVRQGEEAAWSVVLKETAFYPGSGGQPNDTGRLGEARVLDVLDAQDENDELRHIVDRPLAPGPVTGTIDWPRRFDHMQQHTGQHLLSAVFESRHGLPTVSFHLGAEVSTIDLRGKEPGEEILEAAEREANAVIFEVRSVRVRYGTAEELEKLGIRKKVERQGTLRALEIEGIDLQPCGGTHVGNTGQIGLMLLRRVTKIRQDWRLEFVCGERARRTARVDFRKLQGAAAALTCSPDEIVTAVGRMQQERESSFRAARALSERLAVAESRLLVEEAPPRADGLRIIAKVFPEAGAEDLGLLATALAQYEGTVALVAAQGFLIFARHAAVARDMNQLLRETLQSLGGKGGGQPGFARGRLNDPALAEQALAEARKRIG
ncbi:MAG: alanyl-tRNA editing protein [Acidobacteriia bacterium]|nr:alanyl-tRNA editing protein [Terriglobia bacterium]